MVARHVFSPVRVPADSSRPGGHLGHLLPARHRPESAQPLSPTPPPVPHSIVWPCRPTAAPSLPHTGPLRLAGPDLGLGAQGAGAVCSCPCESCSAAGRKLTSRLRGSGRPPAGARGPAASTGTPPPLFVPRPPRPPRPVLVLSGAVRAFAGRRVRLASRPNAAAGSRGHSGLLGGMAARLEPFGAWSDQAPRAAYRRGCRRWATCCSPVGWPAEGANAASTVATP